MASETTSKRADCVLVLQGGGALGSYQAGVVEALAESGFEPDWVAGISIGAINSALIAGNPPERRLERLQTFWERVTSGLQVQAWWPNDAAHAAFNEWSAAWGTVTGAPGFFSHWLPPRALYPAGVPGPNSYYDTSPLRETLLELVDFDRINDRKTRFSVGAVNVETGNMTWFDNHGKESITPEHVMASGALPPGFPAVKIGDGYYWDGGLVSNTPLHRVLDDCEANELTIYQVDLFPARGPLPGTLAAVAERDKDIRYSSRTRRTTDAEKRILDLKAAFRRLHKKLPPELHDDPDVALLGQSSKELSVAIMQLIYARKPYEGSAKDYEFSRATMLEHWAAGAQDARRGLTAPGWLNLKRKQGIVTFDPTHDRDKDTTKD
ncbi:patatin-like phospholipase family protein [Methylopila sp. M107]|uniref:patatin-like phospholipase family protein n=1 Tax=Methylopila sp. M107 TaxID=1101190 RepID=UPI00036CBE96|nr:patatin-like phospholipase family protein [Methylopila sp. M107]